MKAQNITGIISVLIFNLSLLAASVYLAINLSPWCLMLLICTKGISFDEKESEG